MENSETRCPEKVLRMFRPISEYPLSVRTLNTLRAHDVHLLGELITYSDEEVIDWSDSRMRVYGELKTLLLSLGLDFFPEI